MCARKERLRPNPARVASLWLDDCRLGKRPPYLDPSLAEHEPMTILNVQHTTVYRYRRPVRLGDHRLMLRPRDSHDLRLIGTNLNFSPTASTELRIESGLRLETMWWSGRDRKSRRRRQAIRSSIRQAIALTSVGCSSAQAGIVSQMLARAKYVALILPVAPTAIFPTECSARALPPSSSRRPRLESGLMHPKALAADLDCPPALDAADYPSRFEHNPPVGIGRVG
jgi:hypothetical protein